MQYNPLMYQLIYWFVKIIYIIIVKLRNELSEVNFKSVYQISLIQINKILNNKILKFSKIKLI